MEHAQGNLNIEDLPKPPYTPQISTLELDYSAEDSIHFASDGEDEEPTVRLFHLYPFGHRQLHSDQEPFLVPQFSYESAEPAVEMDNEGELYIGLKDLEPPQSIALLFQMAEGTADPTIIDHDVYWSYLSENSWKPLQTDQILRDSTDQLVTSGIVHLFLPEEATNDNTLLPSNLHWVRASMGEHTEAVCDTIAVIAQAAEASFTDRGNDPDFLAEDLAAGSITGLRNSRSEIKSVAQPYAASGGRVQEQPEQYYTRVSERLRHRRRGVTIWDYERLVLERFPSVYKAKCINHSTYDYHRDSLNISRSEFAPGFVTLVIIPNLRKKHAVNPLQPRASLRLLRDIEEYLQEIMPVFAARRIRVINPRYERMQVEFSVTFHTGYDRGHYLDRLKKDITQFLSPWAFRAGEDIMFGGRIHRSNILHFIEKREYVDYVNNFRMHQYPYAEGTEDTLVDIEEARPQTARSILVSHESHTITD
ncbi:MAG TPA: baseplate J/gp47 family protein [bacterium]|nr:baseplate J/gp47 family protein [bacterium]